MNGALKKQAERAFDIAYELFVDYCWSQVAKSTQCFAE